MTSYGKHRFHALDGMRGIAAIAVMLYHYNLNKNYGFLSHFISNTSIAVDFFFVLSGFVVTHAYAARLRDGMCPADYAIRRLARLFPMLAWGLLFAAPFFYALSVQAKPEYTPENAAAALACNLLFIPYMGGKEGLTFPMDPPLWSIFFEMAASVLFIWLARLKTPKLVWVGAVAYALFMIATLYYGPHLLPDTNIGWKRANFPGGIPRVISSFACGMILYRLYECNPREGWIGWLWKSRVTHVLALYPLLALMLFFPYYIKGFYRSFAIMVVSPFLVAQGCRVKERGAFLLAASEFLGWISYPLYCLHMPVRHAVEYFDRQYDIAAFIRPQAVALMATLLLAIGSAYLFDKWRVQQRLVAFLCNAAGQKQL